MREYFTKYMTDVGLSKELAVDWSAWQKVWWHTSPETCVGFYHSMLPWYLATRLLIRAWFGISLAGSVRRTSWQSCLLCALAKTRRAVPRTWQSQWAMPGMIIGGWYYQEGLKPPNSPGSQPLFSGSCCVSPLTSPEILVVSPWCPEGVGYLDTKGPPTIDMKPSKCWHPWFYLHQDSISIHEP